jgi:hypothetical protein
MSHEQGTSTYQKVNFFYQKRPADAERRNRHSETDRYGERHTQLGIEAELAAV